MSERNNKFNYSEVMEVAEELNDIAIGVNKEKEILYSYYKDMGKSWESENADIYLRKIYQKVNNLEKIERKLKNTADAIEEVAKNLNNAEEKVKKLAETRCV